MGRASAATAVTPTRREAYRDELRALDPGRWADHLTARSGLPGPRGNIELAQAVADVGDPACFDRLIATGDEYLVFCGVIGLGRRWAEGAGDEVEARLRRHASDARWRVREAVAMALQRLGDADPARCMDVAERWGADADPLVRRAALAGLCEPRLLTTPAAAARAVGLCARLTAGIAALPPDARRQPGVRVLRQALGYCWSVAVAADPGPGLPVFAALDGAGDRDVAWIVRENRRKARLARLL